jgi:chitin disaccharide deacetylase
MAGLVRRLVATGRAQAGLARGSTTHRAAPLRVSSAKAVRELIVNADDFGQSVGINRGVIAAHERGIVTSTSLMVRWPAAADAAARACAHPALGVGLHLDLGEWVSRNGEWIPVYEVVDRSDVAAVHQEIRRQLDAFRRLTGGEPTHLDSHQHVHQSEPVRSSLCALARELEVPVRHYTPGVRYCGAFYGQTGDGEPLPAAIEVDALLGILGALPEGVIELSCHPGLDDDVDSMYRVERSVEVITLCDARVRAAIDTAGIRLRAFSELMVPGAAMASRALDVAAPSDIIEPSTPRPA